MRGIIHGLPLSAALWGILYFALTGQHIMFTLHAVSALFFVVIFAGACCGIARMIDDALPRIARALGITPRT